MKKLLAAVAALTAISSAIPAKQTPEALSKEKAAILMECMSSTYIHRLTEHYAKNERWGFDEFHQNAEQSIAMLLNLECNAEANALIAADEEKFSDVFRLLISAFIYDGGYWAGMEAQREKDAMEAKEGPLAEKEKPNPL